MTLVQASIEFVKHLFHMYLEKRDFDATLEMMAENITWFGTGAHEICRNYEDARKLLQDEKASWDGYFKILEQWYDATEIGDGIFAVMGELKIREDGLNLILLEMHSRLSFIVKHNEDGMKIIHFHFSVPNAGQNEDEYIHKTLIENYNTKLEETLKERTHLLQEKNHAIVALMANIQGGVKVCKLDDENNIDYINDGFCTLTGYSKEEIHDRLSNNWWNIMKPEDSEKIRELFWDQYKNSGSFALEYPIKRKDDSEIWILEKGSGIISAEGEQLVQSVLTDITKQKQLEKVLKQTNMEMEIIGHASFGVIMCVLEDDNRLGFINNKALDLFGYTRKQFFDEKKDRIDQIPIEEDRNVFSSYLKNLENVTGVINIKIRVRRRDNRIIWLLGCGSCIEDWRGIKMGIYTFQDITSEEEIKLQLIKRNEELAISEKRYEIAVMQSGARMYDYILEDDEIIFPQVFIDDFDLPKKLKNASCSKMWKRIIHPGSLKRFCKMHKLIRNGSPHEIGKIIFFDKNGNEICYEFAMTCIYDEVGKPVRAVALIRDVTKIDDLEKEVQYSQALSANKNVAFEANITRNAITKIDLDWARKFSMLASGIYTDVCDHFKEDIAHEDSKQALKEFFSIDCIKARVAEDETKSSVQFRSKNENDQYIWMQIDMMCILDENTGEINVRCYVFDIDDQKKKLVRMAEEQKLYELMVARSATVYEINITKDIAVKGHEKWDSLYGIMPTRSYTDMIEKFSKNIIYAEDGLEFIRVFRRASVLAAHNRGERELCCEYRKINNAGNATWVCCTMHIFEDLETGDVKGFSYVQDIHEKKLKQLDLIYRAEHDQLTELYNKIKTEQAIDEFLKSDQGKIGKHAFFIMDLDNFKSVNDRLGHAFGDVVISRSAAKVRELFRDHDVLGRIGGDEFVVLMKNISSERAVDAKGKALCKKLRDVYTNNGMQINISASVGAAVYPIDGSDYQSLYRNSDVAMYSSKQNGRDKFSIYKKNMGTSPERDNGIDIYDLVEARSYEQNVSEYLFRILYENNDKKAAIFSVLELVSKQQNISRSYIFENSDDGKRINNTFEWCNKGVASQLTSLQNLNYQDLENYPENFNDLGIFFLPSIKDAKPPIQSILERQNIKSLIQFSIVKNNQFKGFIGFDFCDREIEQPSKTQITELKTVANMLGVFLTEMRAMEIADSMRKVANSIVDNLDSYAYIIDKDTFNLLFINKRTKEIAPRANIGEKCYKAFWNNDAPCERCLMKKLDDDKITRYSVDMHNKFSEKKARVTATWIDWTDGRKVCLMDCTEI